jgi:SAM-dependent methyltransferase
MKKHYSSIVKHYESCLRDHGDSHLGVDWPNKNDAELRYAVMLDIMDTELEKTTVLDFGCGLSHMYEYILRNRIQGIEYAGLDISSAFIEKVKLKYPENRYFCKDILVDNKIPKYDYIIMNGVFTEKRDMSYNEMFTYFKDMLRIIFELAQKGIAFNVMSKHVDWERDDLFHVHHDALTSFLVKEISRKYVIRNDYGLYEYTTYVYK